MQRSCLKAHTVASTLWFFSFDASTELPCPAAHLRNLHAKLKLRDYVKLDSLKILQTSLCFSDGFIWCPQGWQCVEAHYQVKILKLGVCSSSRGLSMYCIIEEVQELPIWFIRLEELDLIWCEELESSVLNFFNDKIHGQSLGLEQTSNFKVFTW